jgi:hypothetical protein
VRRHRRPNAIQHASRAQQQDNCKKIRSFHIPACPLLRQQFYTVRYMRKEEAESAKIVDLLCFRPFLQAFSEIFTIVTKLQRTAEMEALNCHRIVTFSPLVCNSRVLVSRNQTTQ